MCGLNPKSHSGVEDTWPPGYCHLSAARSYESSTAVSSSSKTMNAPEAQATQKVTWLGNEHNTHLGHCPWFQAFAQIRLSDKHDHKIEKSLCGDESPGR